MLVSVEWWSDTACDGASESSGGEPYSLIAWPAEIGTATDDIDLFPGIPADITSEEDIGTRLKTKPEHITNSEGPDFGSIGSRVSRIERIIRWSSSISIDTDHLAC